MASISITLSADQVKAIELFKANESDTVSSIVKAQVQSFANNQMRQALNNAVNGGGPSGPDGSQTIERATDEQVATLFASAFASA